MTRTMIAGLSLLSLVGCGPAEVKAASVAPRSDAVGARAALSADGQEPQLGASEAARDEQVAELNKKWAAEEAERKASAAALVAAPPKGDLANMTEAEFEAYRAWVANADKPKTANGPLTRAAYDRLTDGMSVLEVWSIIPEEACDEFVRGGTGVSYTCNDGGNGVMAVMFVDGELVSKSQNGLRR